jgi:hypothetical protein
MCPDPPPQLTDDSDQLASRLCERVRTGFCPPHPLLFLRFSPNGAGRPCPDPSRPITRNGPDRIFEPGPAGAAVMGPRLRPPIMGRVPSQFSFRSKVFRERPFCWDKSAGHLVGTARVPSCESFRTGFVRPLPHLASSPQRGSDNRFRLARVPLCERVRTGFQDSRFPGVSNLARTAGAHADPLSAATLSSAHGARRRSGTPSFYARGNNP